MTNSRALCWELIIYVVLNSEPGTAKAWGKTECEQSFGLRLCQGRASGTRGWKREQPDLNNGDGIMGEGWDMMG